mgnify:CR=1 FL=1
MSEAHNGRQLAALGLYHDYSGYVVFSVAIILMVAFGAALNVDYRAKWGELKGRLEAGGNV